MQENNKTFLKSHKVFFNNKPLRCSLFVDVRQILCIVVRLERSVRLYVSTRDVQGCAKYGVQLQKACEKLLFKDQLRDMKKWMFLLAILLCGCTNNRVVCHETDGVSLSLAERRQQQISDVKYHLFFSIPSLKSQDINAQVEIEFNSASDENVVLDFKANPESVLSVNINGDSSYVVANEHIILPQIKKGMNRAVIELIAPSQSLNRSDDYLYTLLVPDRARTLFPCFDQPNLKALYTLQLQIPEGWKAVSNSPISDIKGDTITFAQTEPLSTYLFSFVAGVLDQVSDSRDGRTISLYHRETDPQKTAQLKDIMDEVFHSLRWMEDYTGVNYPFSKYDLIILPGFQYGGMEHTGATLYADRTMFLSPAPTENERLTRSKLIAHETAHMWFGDYVTMNWFNDVWTKEVFANYFGSQIVAPRFSDINHDLNFLMEYASSAYSEERTDGTNSIQQHLDNLQDAGLIYGNIIYTKSPIVMNMLVERIGKEAFRKGIQEYLRTYAYGNATWDHLIAILDDLTPLDLKEWSRVWIKEKGMPTIVSEIKGDTLIVRQMDKYKRGMIWPQKLTMLADGDTVTIDLTSEMVRVKIPHGTTSILPNIDGRGYGFFQLDEATFRFILKNLSTFDSEVTRGSLLLTLYENVLNHVSLAPEFIAGIGEYLKKENKELLFSQAVSQAKSCCYLAGGDCRQFEETLYDLYRSSNSAAYRTIALRAYYQIAQSKEAVANCYDIWEKADQLSERDAIRMSYELAVRMPEKADEIVSEQLSRLTNKDRIREYCFVSPAVSSSQTVRDSVFNALLSADNREIEPYAETTLSYLNHPMRADSAVRYIRKGLEAVQDVKSTGDIFFPKAWAGALLWGHHSKEANDSVNAFFNENPNYPVMLGNKIKQQAYFLQIYNNL